jgi:hypothetical protein
MSPGCEHLDTALPKAAQFATTHWSVAGHAGFGGALFQTLPRKSTRHNLRVQISEDWRYTRMHGRF